MNKPFYSILGVIFLMAACANNKTQAENKAENAPTVENTSLDTAVVKTSQVPTEKKSNTVFPPGTFKNYPEIVKSLFGKGSSMQEVRTVMGQPELTETPKQGLEVWYYGATEVHFEYQYVSEVVNQQECKKFVDMATLLISHDPIEKKFGQHLLEGASKHSKYN